MNILVYFSPYILLFDNTSAPQLQQEKAEGQIHSTPDKLLCHVCKTIITDSSAKIEQQGNHVHHRTNPSGFNFEFGCFQQAPGCAGIGEAVSEFSWFNNYSWQIAVCRGCEQHLGWLFKGDDRFYGLILNRLVQSNRE